MNREDIIRMAEEASGGRQPDGWGVMLDHEQLERFANLVAAAEREACAKLAVEESAEWHICSQSHDTANMIAAAIRARGQNENA